MGLDLAGLLYLNGKYRLNPNYQTLVSEYYQSKVESGSSADEVNAWVKQATNGQIQEIISQNDLVDFFIALVNAIHLKATWTKPFNPEDTRPAFFMKPTGKISVKMMQTVAQFEYLEHDSCQAVKLKYSDKSGISMMLILPKEDNDFAFIDDSFFEQFSDWMTTERVQVAVPKFKIEHEVDIKKFLEEKGLKGLFGKPDFSNLADLTHPATQEALTELKISTMIQKSALVCDEEGTEASSATAAVIVLESLSYSPEHTVEITFNRPFLAALISEKDLTPIQFAVIRNPTAP